MPPDRGIVVHHPAHVVDELDDKLGHVVAGRRLAREDLDARHEIARGVGADLVVERDGLQDVEELALILVDALDLDVEKRLRVHFDREPVVDELGERFLVLRAHAGIALLEACIVREFLKVPERLGPVHEFRADGVADKFCQAGVGFEQPAPESDAVGLVDDAAGIEAVEVVEQRLP